MTCQMNFENSWRRCGSGAAPVNLPAWSGLRRDVDFVNDITTLVGLGGETAALAATLKRPTLAGATQ